MEYWFLLGIILREGWSIPLMAVFSADKKATGLPVKKNKSRAALVEYLHTADYRIG